MLDIYPLSDPSDGSAQALPDPSEVCETLSSLLPSPDTVLTEEFIKSPLFPVTLSRDIAKLFGFGDVSDDVVTHLGLSDLDRGNESVMTHVWFLTFLGYDVDTIQTALELYRRTRGSPNLLRRTQAASSFPGNMQTINPDSPVARQAAPNKTSQGLLAHEQIRSPSTIVPEGAQNTVGTEAVARHRHTSTQQGTQLDDAESPWKRLHSQFHQQKEKIPAKPIMCSTLQR